jgi:transcription elongation GreA/GreB family factor
MISVPMTREAYQRKRAEVELMEGDQMSAITEKIAEARAEGDLKENITHNAKRRDYYRRESIRLRGNYHGHKSSTWPMSPKMK